MRKLRRRLEGLTKWILFFKKGLSTLPGYIRYWGFALGMKRTIKSLVLPGIHQMMLELTDFLEAEESKVRISRRPDYIVIAPDFIGNSAGICCLYQLAADLKKSGFEAAITGSQRGNPKYPVPLISTKQAREAAKNGAWVIYPEIINGNPLKARNVIRWTLNKPGLLGGDEVYPESEHVFVYSEVFAPYLKNKIQGKLYMPTIDRTIFFPPENDEPRALTCYYVGKSRYKDGVFDPKTTLEITRNTPPKSELGKIFRAAKVLYCFDNSTALIYEALLCGCHVIVIPDGTQTWEDYQKLELGTSGILWGANGAPKEPFQPIELQERLAVWEAEYKNQLKYLVDYSQKIEASPFVKPQIAGNNRSIELSTSPS